MSKEMSAQERTSRGCAVAVAWIVARNRPENATTQQEYSPAAEGL